MSHSPVQEDLAKNQAMDDDAPQSEVAAGAEDGSDAESDSSFGGFASDSDAPAKKRRKDKAAASRKEEASLPPKAEGKDPKDNQKDNRKEPAAKSKAAKAKQERADKVLAAAKKATASAQELSTDMVWRNIVRVGEVERRIQKVNDTQNQLKSLMDNEGFFANDGEVLELVEKMVQLGELMTDFKELCRMLRSITSDQLENELRQGGEVPRLFLNVFDSVLSDKDHPTLVDMLTTLAKKLLSVSWLLLRVARQWEAKSHHHTRWIITSWIIYHIKSCTYNSQSDFYHSQSDNGVMVCNLFDGDWLVMVMSHEPLSIIWGRFKM